MVALHPGRPMVVGEAVGEGRGLPKVDHPDAGFARPVVDKQEWAADDLHKKQTNKQTNKIKKINQL